MADMKRALVSVYDKTGVVAFVKELLAVSKMEILSTGGTAKELRDNGIEVRDVSDYTGFPECLDGRVKTLHPKVHGGILGRRDLPAHVEKMKELDIEGIDMVVINLYPFEETVAKENVSTEEVIENIDIGGPAMIRSAAKNHRDVIVVVDTDDYGPIVEELRDNDGVLPQKSREKLAYKAFGYTSWYDSRISEFFGDKVGKKTSLSSDHMLIPLKSVQRMRYGENPHQKAAFYRVAGAKKGGIPDAVQHHGKELSYNNIVDMAAAFELVCEFDEPACAIIKHTNPCGVARADFLVEAYEKALECDPVSAFGGVIAFNREVDKATADELSKLFIEIVIAPAFDNLAIETLKAKKNLRIMTLPVLEKDGQFEAKMVRGGALVQESDSVTLEEGKLKVVSKRQPSDEEMRALKFAWVVAKHVKSNAIVYADENSAIGVGAGQMSRVDSSKIAVLKATRPIEGSVMASDAFFPFRDSIDEAAKAGVVAIIQPGGSVRDKEVISAADEHGMAMVFTGIRHFKH